MNYIYLSIPAIFLLTALIFMIIFHFKKKAVIKKVNSLNPCEKSDTLNNLSEPLGYMYDPCQDIFMARQDATQKVFGYTTFYDLSAPYFNMVFDYETIYFDYAGRTWLIEMWKGQYGINTGCELGVYYADKVIPHGKYSSTLYKAVNSKDMLDISLKLNRHCHKKHCKYSKLGHVCKKHWWLTCFKIGCFSKPKELFVNISITFKDCKMMQSFLDSFKATLPDTTYKVNGLTIYFTFCQSKRKYSLWKRFIRHISLGKCRIYCQWFNCLTRPFRKSGDKILYFYYYLPFVVRRMFKQKRNK